MVEGYRGLVQHAFVKVSMCCYKKAPDRFIYREPVMYVLIF